MIGAPRRFLAYMRLRLATLGSRRRVSFPGPLMLVRRQTPPKSNSLRLQSRVGAALIGSLAGSAAPPGTRDSPTRMTGSARLKRVFMRLKVTLFESHNETLMNARVTLEVLRDGRRAHILDGKVGKLI